MGKEWKPAFPLFERFKGGGVVTWWLGGSVKEEAIFAKSLKGIHTKGVKKANRDTCSSAELGEKTHFLLKPTGGP